MKKLDANIKKLKRILDSLTEEELAELNNDPEIQRLTKKLREVCNRPLKALGEK